MLVSSCETKLECGHWVARPGHQTPDDAERGTDQERDGKENIIIDPEIQEGIIKDPDARQTTISTIRRTPSVAVSPCFPNRDLNYTKSTKIAESVT